MKKKWMMAVLATTTCVALMGCKKEEPKQPETVVETTNEAETKKETEKETETVQPETQKLVQTEAVQPETQEAVQTEAVQPETQEAVQTEAVLPETQAAVQTEVAVLETESVTHPTAATATLYIGYDGSFQEYPFETTEAITPEALVQGIADLTGWDLTLADAITSGKGGMTVCFSSQCSLFTGPPAQQKEEFHMFDTYQLAATILGSIQRTLQCYAIDPTLGDPSNLDIYYCMEGNQPLTISEINVTIPLETPYHGIS